MEAASVVDVGKPPPDAEAQACAGPRRPLGGVRVLTAEQMAAVPFATQLMARLGADVVKVERPAAGDSGRASQPAVVDPQGRAVGATFLRNNLGKRSVTLNLKDPRGVALFLRLAERFDVVCENFKAGAADRLGIGYEAVRAVNGDVVYLSVSGFGGDPASPYFDRPAYASIVEAMSGIYEYKRKPGQPPAANPVGALGDISSALFGVIGVLAALRQRDSERGARPLPARSRPAHDTRRRGSEAAGGPQQPGSGQHHSRRRGSEAAGGPQQPGSGQHIDIAMLDATVAMTDIVTNFFSLGIPDEASSGAGIVETFAAGRGHFVLQVVREHHFERLAEVTGHPEWLADERLAGRRGWVEHLETLLRPGVERWASGMTNRQAAAELAAAGIAAGPSLTSAEVCADPHLAVRDMIAEMPRPDGGRPVLVPGNPVKMSRAAQGPETRVPWLGEQTDAVLRSELGLSAGELAGLRADAVI